jgi:tetratricopeptide (TPR) repeat protein
MNARIELLTNLLAESPGDSFTLFALAKEHEKINEPERALDFYRQLRAADPDYLGLYYHLGKVLERLDQPDAAIEAYRAGMAVAKAAHNLHALGELNGARLALDDEEV